MLSKILIENGNNFTTNIGKIRNCENFNVSGFHDIQN
jgi:hypothetical protein